MLVFTLSIHHVFCVFWLGRWVEIFGLDLRSIAKNCTTHASPMDSLMSSDSTDGHRVFNHRLLIEAWPARAREYVSFSSACPSRLPLQLSTAKAFGGTLQIRLSLLARGHPTVERGPHAPSLVAPTPLPLAGFQLLFFIFFFIYVAWDFVFLHGKLLYLELCWVISCLRSFFRTLSAFLLLLPSFGGCCRSQLRMQLGLSWSVFLLLLKPPCVALWKDRVIYLSHFPKFCIYFSAASVWFGSNVWGAHPFFINRIAHFFFLSDQRWKGSSLVTIFLIQLENKK
jgi:hypothetical protein